MRANISTYIHGGTAVSSNLRIPFRNSVFLSFHSFLLLSFILLFFLSFLLFSIPSFLSFIFFWFGREEQHGWSSQFFDSSVGTIRVVLNKAPNFIWRSLFFQKAHRESCAPLFLSLACMCARTSAILDFLKHDTKSFMFWCRQVKHIDPWIRLRSLFWLITIKYKS